MYLQVVKPEIDGASHSCANNQSLVTASGLGSAICDRVLLGRREHIPPASWNGLSCAGERKATAAPLEGLYQLEYTRVLRETTFYCKCCWTPDSHYGTISHWTVTHRSMSVSKDPYWCWLQHNLYDAVYTHIFIYIKKVDCRINDQGLLNLICLQI